MLDPDVDVEAFVEDNRDTIVQILRCSSDPFARACCWTLLDRASSDPELEQLEQELAQVKASRGLDSTTSIPRFDPSIADADGGRSSSGPGSKGGQVNFCPQCGTDVVDGDQYCRQCGRNLGEEESDRA